jgi:hypothetical protein
MSSSFYQVERLLSNSFAQLTKCKISDDNTAQQSILRDLPTARLCASPGYNHAEPEGALFNLARLSEEVFSPRANDHIAALVNINDSESISFDIFSLERAFSPAG